MAQNDACTNSQVAEQQLTEQLLKANGQDKEESDLVSEIRAWLMTQEKIVARTDTAFLLRFLRGCKYNVEKAQTKIHNFYTIRSKAPEWFERRDPALPQILELLTIGVFIPLQQRDPQGRLVVIIRAAAHDPQRHLQNDVFKVGKMILDLALEEDETIPIHGVVAIFDLSGVTLAHAMQLTPSIIKKAVHTWQDCYPVSPKRLDFINAPLYVNVVLNIFRKFMGEKMRKRVFVHFGGIGNLHKNVTLEILPKEYGGNNGTMNELIEYWKQQVVAKRNWYTDDEKYKATPPQDVTNSHINM